MRFIRKMIPAISFIPSPSGRQAPFGIYLHIKDSPGVNEGIDGGPNADIKVSIITSELCLSIS